MRQLLVDQRRRQPRYVEQPGTDWGAYPVNVGFGFGFGLGFAFTVTRAVAEL